MRRTISIALLVVLAACSLPTEQSSVPVSAFTPLRFSRPNETYGGLHWLASQGIGEAITNCGGSDVAIAGGAYSATATDIGSGFPGAGGNTWVVYTANPKAYVTSYALCAFSQGLTNYFYRVYGKTTVKHKTMAAASCNAGDFFVAGWSGYATSDGPIVAKGVPTGWIANGSNGLVTAFAECATRNEWTQTGMAYITKTSGAGRLFIGCGGSAGDNDDVVGSAFGNSSSSGGGTLGPPAQEYPSLSGGGGSTGPTGVEFVNPKSIVGWVVCQEDS